MLRALAFLSRLAAVALLSCATAVVAPGAAAAPAATPSSKEKQQELNELRGKIERLQKSLEAAESSRTEAADALKASERAVSESNRQLHQLVSDRNALNQELSGLNQRAARTQQEIDAQRQLLDRMLVHQYRQGGTDGFRLILEGRDLGTVERQLHYLGYISRARFDTIKRLNAGLADIAVLRTEIESKKQELAENESVQRASRQQLEKEKSERKRLLASLAGDIAKNRKEIGRLKRDEDRLSKLVEQLAKLVTPKPAQGSGRIIDDAADKSIAGMAFRVLKGKLKLPARGELINRYGGPRDEAGVTWKGLFIRAASGQPVNAVADGRVIHADWFRGYGNLLVVDHGSGYMSVYGYTESMLKQTGETVRAGDRIALTGDSGGVGDSGVYFELRHQGKTLDPMQWIRK
jgi:murein hydrolase activator